MKTDCQPKTIFITGTDTGVGKTVLTALLLSHLRQTGCCALAVKPFCSGGRADAELLHSLQEGDLTLDEINPYHFSEPLAPLVAARFHDRKITLRQSLRHIQKIGAHLKNPSIHLSINTLIKRATPPLHQPITPVLLLEGAGGLLAPLGEGFNLLDLILACAPGIRPKSGIQHPASSIQTVIVALNLLGTINHTLLTAHRLRAAKIRRFKVVLMNTSRPDASSHSNAGVLAQLLTPNPVETIPFLGHKALRLGNIRKNSKWLADILGRISEPAHL